MSSVNKVTILGRLGADPEVRHFENGSTVAKTRVATTEKYTNKEGQKIENTEWHTIVFWRGLAGVVEKYLKKGDQVYVEGRLKTRSWEDQDGNKRYATDIEAREMVMLGGNRNSNSGQSNSVPNSVYEQEAMNKSANGSATQSQNTSKNEEIVSAKVENPTVQSEKKESFEDDLPF